MNFIKAFAIYSRIFNSKILIFNNSSSQVHLQYFNASPDHTFKTSLLPCNKCSLNDDSSFILYNMRNKHKAYFMMLPLYLCVDIKTSLLPTIGHICSLSPYMLYVITLYSYNLTDNSIFNISPPCPLHLIHLIKFLI
ncbi:4052_t:CDS:2 [Funneliformis mosseae]|uniref:4052_t:CDS:1 n=1 Tax=Funneliformis mosseae TaxID=27381 RepID=A0A9N8VCH3_FUNMO|nr:4052_t:CDS:2 [Funneliformis mosseae]